MSRALLSAIQCLAFASLFAGGVVAQTKERPVGLLMLPGDAQVLRIGTETALAAKAGDILFPGDAVIAGQATATFLSCPDKSSFVLAPHARAEFGDTGVQAENNALSGQKPVASCFLPQVVRVATASQQHYGVSMTRGLGEDDPAGAEDSDFPPQLSRDLSMYDAVLNDDPNDPVALTARAALFEQHDLPANALAEYKKLGGVLKDAVWVRGKMFELQERMEAEELARRAEEFADGKTLALLVGVSEYQKLPQELWLQYADDDALTFDQYLKSPRGGRLPPENIRVLTNEEATAAGIRNAFQTFLKGAAGKNNTIVILLAGHAVVENPGRRRAYIIAHDSDLQDLESTGVPMDEIRELIQQNLSNVGRLILYTDVCRAGQLGSIQSNTVNSSVEEIGDAEGDIFGFMASRPREVSFEGPEFGGGHGAFSYYVLKALNGEGDEDGDRIVSFNELIDYVRTEVPRNTRKKQHPRDFGTLDTALPAADVSKEGIELAHFRRLYDFRNSEPLYLASAAAQLPAGNESDLNEFSEALEAGRLLPSDDNSAFDALERLQGRLPEPQFRAQQNRLRVALEDRAQQTLLTYLEGEEVPQAQDEFELAASYTSAARRLTPESVFLDGRESFFAGRAKLFDKRWGEASEELERAVRVDRGGAYAYNALGISYLEQADFQRAIPAFRDAARLAVHWVYPLHNLALAYVETGRYSEAIDTYKKAIELKPDYGYLPYNLGLVYQRLNRRREAEASYRQAMSLSPDSPEPYNAMGALYAARNRESNAEAMYREALQRDPEMLEARHNLATLLADQPGRFNEAEQLWKANLEAAPDYLASRLALAEGLAVHGQAGAAVEQYEVAIEQRPEYPAARAALADLLADSGETDRALTEYHQLLQIDPDSIAGFEGLGDIEASRGNNGKAGEAYRQALDRNPDRKTTKRLKGKLKRLK